MSDRAARRAPPGWRLLGPFAWLLCCQYFVAEQIARAGWTMRYSPRSNYISDLGALGCTTSGTDPICSPLHAVMNGSFVLQGCLIVIGAVAVRPWLPSRRIVAVARALLVLSGATLALVGVFPEDAAPSIHYRVAAVHFLSADLAMLLLGAAQARRGSQLRPLGWLTLTCGVVAVVGLAFLGARVAGDLGIGTLERIAAYPFPFWLSVSGAVFLARGADAAVTSSPVLRR